MDPLTRVKELREIRSNFDSRSLFSRNFAVEMVNRHHKTWTWTINHKALQRLGSAKRQPYNGVVTRAETRIHFRNLRLHFPMR